MLSGPLGVVWIVWCASMYYVVFEGTERAFDARVITPFCTEACRAQHAEFERLRWRGHGGPPTACLCRSGAAIPTSMPDLGVLLGVLLFLPVCGLPLFIVEWRALKRRRRT